METMIKNTRREVIDIPEDVFGHLSTKATAQGTNLKEYIEDLLIKKVEDALANEDDNEAYEWLSKHHPDGTIPASKEEQDKFREWLFV